MTANNETHPQRLDSNRVGLNPSTEGVVQVSHDNAWSEKVARGRALVSEKDVADWNVKWGLGDLANEVCPAGDDGCHNDAVLDRFADEIGVSVVTLRNYRYVAAAWPAVTRVTAQTWTTHRTLAGHVERRTIINEQVWTYNSLSERLGRQPNPSRNVIVDRETGEILTGKPTPEQVHEAIKADPAIERVARKALDEKYEESPKPVNLVRADGRDQLVDLVAEFRHLHVGVDRIVQLVNEGKAVISTGEGRSAILREIGWLRTALGYIESGIETDSLADEVAAFLQEVS